MELMQNGGIQFVPPIAVQYIYLDFDGELTGYNGEILTIDKVEVKHAHLNAERIGRIVSELNARYVSGNVIFVTERPVNTAYSTIYVGKTDAFDPYGNFCGLAETIDNGNANLSDNAFVMLDAGDGDDAIIAAIAHETGHLLGTLRHGGAGLNAYAARYNIKSGTTSAGISLGDGDNMFISNGGTANDTTILSGGSLTVRSGGLANGTTIQSSGHMVISRGGSASGSIIYSGGRMYIAAGGSAENITASGGIAEIAGGGAATGVNAPSGTGLILTVAPDTFVRGSCAGTPFEIKNATLSGYTVYSGNSLSIASRGTAADITVLSGGRIEIAGGGSATGITVQSGAGLNMVVTSDTCIRGTSAGTAFEVADAGISGYTVCSGNSLSVAGGGAADGITVSSGGVLYVSGGGTAGGTVVKTGGELDISGGAVNSTCLSGINARMYVSSGGAASNTTVSGGQLYITGGTAENTVLDGGVLYITSNAAANNTTIHSAGILYVSGNGSANGLEVDSGGMIFIFSGGTATDIAWTPCEGFLDIQDGAYVTFTSRYSGVYFGEDEQLLSAAQTMNNKVVTGDMFVMNDGVANNTAVSDGSMEVWHGGNANNTAVNYLGDLFISSGGIASNTTLNHEGWMDILNGGSAACTTVNNDGNLTISSGGIHGGTLQIAAGGKVYAHYGATIDFTVADRSTADGYLINDLSQISGSPDYTITVSADQAQGIYKLAQGVDNFYNSISIGTDGQNYGTASINETPLLYNDTSYAVNLNNGELTLTITSSAVPEPVLNGDPNGLSFTDLSGDTHIVEFSQDNFATVLTFEVERNAVDLHNLPDGTYQWQVDDIRGNDITASGNAPAPQTFTADGDSNPDIFFAGPDGVWGSGYAAEYQGDPIRGISEPLVLLQGKNKITDCFHGMGDPNILLLTDDANGDALFADDIYSARPAEMNQNQSRLHSIGEIRAGAGNDVIDLTSRQLWYEGWEMTIRGGDGDDVIWASGGDNDLFGDAGNDRIIGSSGFDVIVGGTGDDCMNGGGGNDIFCFGNDWGNDIVILNGPSESCTLWFASGSADNWDAAARIYRDGSNSVTIQGEGNVQLYFGDDYRALPGQYADLQACGAFSENSSEKIFEDKNKGMIA